MKGILLIILLLSVFAVDVSAQLKGTVVDAESGDSIANVSVSYKGKHVATICDNKGSFTIEKNSGWYLTFSAVGYKMQRVFISSGTSDYITVRMIQDMHSLSEVVVKASKGKYSRKNNPAVELMRRVIAAKKKSDFSNHDFYQYNKYQKITLAVNDVKPSDLDSGLLKKHKWLVDHIEVCPYNNKLILPISVDETVTENIYRKNPKSEKNIVIGQNTRGLNDLIETGEILNVILKDVFTDVDLYDDQIRLLRYPFTSPIGKDAVDFYRFYIEDTVKVDNDLCYHLQFIPNNQQDFGFRGDIYILADSTLHVRKCNLTIPKKSDVNFVDNIHITQEYKKLDNGEWGLSIDDMMVELKISKGIRQFAVIRTTRMDDYSFAALPDRMFRGKAKVVQDPNSMIKGTDFWTKYRKVDLTRSEGTMGDFVSRIEQIKGFKYIIFGIKALVENYVETGDNTHNSKVDIGPINTMVTRNFVDGWRTRASALTTAKLNPNWFVSGYYARGWGSHKNYYQGELTYSFNKKKYLPWEFPKRTLTFVSTYDVASPSDKFLDTDKDNVFTAFKWSKVDKMMFYNRQQLSFEYEEDWGFKTTISLKAEELQACGNMFYTPLSKMDFQGERPNDYLRTTEARLEFRYCPGATFINTKQRRIPVNREAPEFSIGHTIGFKGVLGGNYDFNYSEFRFFKRNWLKSWGRLDVYFKGGIQWNKVPFPLLIMPAANQSYFIQKETFNLINNMEFMNDRYLSLDLGWNLNGKIFNRIPIIKKLKWREFVSVKCLWGGLSDKNNPTLAANAGDPTLMAFPEGCYVMDSKRPYWEVSVGIHNIFKLIRIEYVRRLNYLNLPTANKQGIRFMVVATF